MFDEVFNYMFMPAHVGSISSYFGLYRITGQQDRCLGRTVDSLAEYLVFDLQEEQVQGNISDELFLHVLWVEL